MVGAQALKNEHCLVQQVEDGGSTDDVGIIRVVERKVEVWGWVLELVKDK